MFLSIYFEKFTYSFQSFIRYFSYLIASWLVMLTNDGSPLLANVSNKVSVGKYLL